MTENLQKELVSFAYLQTVAGLAGFQCIFARIDDDSVDVQIQAGADFHPTSPRLEVQLKATADPSAIRADSIAWRLKRKNYDDLRRLTLLPRILVVLGLPPDPAAWFDQSEDGLCVRKAAYWVCLTGSPAVTQERTTVHLPRSHLLTPEALRRLMLDSAWRPNP
jgi:hypothetical protein